MQHIEAGGLFIYCFGGGGYIGSYVHARLNGVMPGDYNNLFLRDNEEYLKKH
jgi:hypothetical protein